MAKKGYIFKRKDNNETLSVIADYLYGDITNTYIEPQDIRQFNVNVVDLNNSIDEFDEDHFDGDKVKNTITTSKLGDEDASYYASKSSYDTLDNNIKSKINNINNSIIDINSTCNIINSTNSFTNNTINSINNTLNSINATISDLNNSNTNLNDRMDVYDDIINNYTLSYSGTTNVRDDLKLSQFSNDSILTIISDINNSIQAVGTNWNTIKGSFDNDITGRTLIKNDFLMIENEFDNTLNLLVNTRNNLEDLIDGNSDINIRSLKVGSNTNPYISDIYLDGSNLIVKGNDQNVSTSTVDGIRINNNRPYEIYINSTKVLNVYYENETNLNRYQLYKYRFKVEWLNYNGTLLETDYRTYNHTPQYDGATPVHPSDVVYNYTFTGWSPTIVPLTQDARYTAQFAYEYVQYPISIGLEYRNGSYVESLAADETRNVVYIQQISSSSVFNSDVYETTNYVYSGKNIESTRGGIGSTRICTYYTYREVKLYAYYIRAIYNDSIIDETSGRVSYNTQIPVSDIYGDTFQKNGFIYSGRSGATRVNIRTDGQVVEVTYSTRTEPVNYLYIPSPSETFYDDSSTPVTGWNYTGYSGTLTSSITDRLYTNFNSNKDKVEVYINGTWYNMNNLPTYWSVTTDTFTYDGTTYYGIKIHYDDWWYDDEDYSNGSDMSFYVGTDKASGSPYRTCLQLRTNVADYPNYSVVRDFQVRIKN